MNKEVEKIRKYLKSKGIKATEDEIIDAAIRIARRFGEEWSFVCEFKPVGWREKDENNK